MVKKLDPNTCRQYKRKVGKGDSICCFCWYHLKCSGLRETEFENRTKSKNLYWSCPDCVVYRCEKCAKVIGKKQESIFYDCCNKWLHKKCSLLATNVFERLSESNEPWFCWDCLKNNISCISLDSTKIQTLFGTLPKQTTISESSGIPFCRTCNRNNSQPKSGLECVQCKFAFHKKCQKNPNFNTFVCNFCNKEMFPFAEIDLRDLIDLSFNSNYICSCLENNKLKNNSEDFMNKIINLKELNFDKNQSYSNKDPNDHVIDPTNFSYYLTHDFHKLHKKNSNKTNNTNFSVLHTNICSLQGNFNNLEQLNNLEYEFDIIGLTETWHTEGNQNFISGLLTGYQNYEGISGSTLKGCGFYIKNNIICCKAITYQETLKFSK